MKRIYLDNAATTPARAQTIDAMLPLLAQGGYNPSSIHAEGRSARAALDRARDTVAGVLAAKSREIVFTGSGSESIGLALNGVARAARGRHIVTSVVEHHAVLHVLDGLERDGWSITRLPLSNAGALDVAAFVQALRPDTALATFMLANNETGSIAPIARAAAIARGSGVVFHTDAVQGPAFLRLDVQALGVDLLSLSGHKFYGPKGVGMLYVRSGVSLAPQIVGGGQEHGLRAGTENVAGIAGFAAALELAQAEHVVQAARVGQLRDRLEAGILAGIPGVIVNAASLERLPNVSSIAFEHVTAATLLIGLDLAGVAASAGSACAAGSLEPSHVAAALNLPAEYRPGVIRFSLGYGTTEQEIDSVLALLPGIVAQVRDRAIVV